MMINTEFLGFCAATLTTLAFLPQTIKIIRTRETQGLSLVMYSMFTLGVFLWLLYGLRLGSLPIIAANIVTIVLSVIILFYILTTGASRLLSKAEIALIPQSFVSTIDIARVRFISRAHSPFTVGRIVCRGYDIYWKDYPEDFTALSITSQALLMHELCHVWQYTTGRLSALSYLTSPKAWVYGYEFDPSKSFDDYPCERQADLLQDWYAMNKGQPPARHAKGSTQPTLAQINAVVPFEFDVEASAPNKRSIGLA